MRKHAGTDTSSRLRHLMTLQEEARAGDGAGGYTRSWQNIADVWGEIVPMSGKEKLANAQLQSRLTHKIMLRYRSGVNTAMRIAYAGRVFHIRAVANIQERGELLELWVEEWL